MENHNATKAPVIICGDFNSKPYSSVTNCMNNLDYTPDPLVKAYKKQAGIDFYNKVKAHFDSSKSQMSHILGKLKSSYSLFNL
jgi:endonuclease/exonuclease/phosphatase family metal-dependent hydrolase